MQSTATAVEISENGKLSSPDGPGVSATYASIRGSCSPDCLWYDNGCYAQSGRVAITVGRLDAAAAESGADARDVARAEARAIDGLSGKRLLRLHVSGDCRTSWAARIVGAAVARYEARATVTRTGKATWTYTHSWRNVARADSGPAVSVLASCETTADARAAMKAGYAAALVVPQFESQGAYKTDGITVLPCPAQTKGKHCDECRLCLDDDRLRKAGIVIAFEAHSRGAGQIKRTLTALNVVKA